MSYWGEDFRQVFHLQRRTGQDYRGTPTYGPIEAHPCRYDAQSRLVRTADGRQQATQGTLLTAARFSLRDRFWLPGESAADESKARLPKDVREHSDLETGEYDHTAVDV